MSNTNALVKNLENQVVQMAKALAEQLLGSLLIDLQENRSSNNKPLIQAWESHIPCGPKICYYFHLDGTIKSTKDKFRIE